MLAEVARAWGLADLPDRVEVTFSSRMTRNFGTCRYDGRLTVARRLLDGSSESLREVLVHEAAHYAAFVLHGRQVRPHGREWAALMREVGLVPRASLPALPGDPPPKPAQYYLHRCPRCAASRVARRRVPTWRCVRCRKRGRRGVLEIVRLP